jgi:hypothetical protein
MKSNEAAVRAKQRDRANGRRRPITPIREVDANLVGVEVPDGLTTDGARYVLADHLAQVVEDIVDARIHALTNFPGISFDRLVPLNHG